MADDAAPEVEVEAVSEGARHWRIRLAGAPIGNLYLELTESRARLYLDGDYNADVVRRVLDKANTLLGDLPGGTCVVYRGHLVSSFRFGT
jgi:hypothetical protein